MNSSAENNSVKIDWKHLDALTDNEIGTFDSPPLTGEFSAKAAWLMPGESLPRGAVRVELELNPKILAAMA